MNAARTLAPATGPGGIARGESPAPAAPAAWHEARGADASPAESAPGSDASASPWPDVAVLLLAQVRPAYRPWLFGRLVRGTAPLQAAEADARPSFARVLGSGHEGGFGLRPSFDRGGLFLLFHGEAAARRFVETSPVAAAYRARAQELLVAVLRASSVRGRWGGMTMQVSAAAEPGAPVASLTRASIRPRRALEFWRHAAPAQAALAGAEGCELLAGLGEAPLLRQATFSLWRDGDAMDAYARQGAHQAAIRSAWGRQFFAESMFVRFVPLSLRGRWLGRDHDFERAVPAGTPGDDADAAGGRAMALAPASATRGGHG